jgi:hypothetical protein
VIVDRKVAVAVTAVHAMAVGPKVVVDWKVAADVGRTMALVIVVREIAVPKGVVAARVAAPKVADQVGRMARRDRRIRSGSSIALMKTKTAR